MFTFAMIAVISVAIRVYREITLDDEPVQNARDYMAEEIYMAYLDKTNVVRGIFRKHNQGFRDHGIHGPKGTA